MNMAMAHQDPTALQWLEIQLHTLYRVAPDGRLQFVNEPGDSSDAPAPRFFMGRTPVGNLWRYHIDLPDAVIAQLEPLCRAEPTVADLAAPPQAMAAIRAILADHAPITVEYRGPAYWIPDSVQPSPQATLFTDAHLDLLPEEFAWLAEPDSYRSIGPVAAVIVDGQVVSLCFCSRVPGRATEAGLETLPAFRGQGYAVAAVATWAAAVHARGWHPLYSTEWTNLASQRVAQKLGAIHYGEDWSLY